MGKDEDHTEDARPLSYEELLSAVLDALGDDHPEGYVEAWTSLYEDKTTIDGMFDLHKVASVLRQRIGRRLLT